MNLPNKSSLGAVIKQFVGSYIFKGSSVLFFMKILGALLAYVLQWYIIYVSDEKQYGIYAYIINTTFLFATFGLLGFESSINRFFPVYLKNNETSSIKGFMVVSYLLPFVLNSLIALTFYLVVINSTILTEYHHILYFLLFMMPLLGFVKLNAKYFTASRNVFWGIFPNEVIRYLAFMITLFILTQVRGKGLEALQLLTISVGVYLLVVTTQFSLLFKKFKSFLLTKGFSFETKTWVTTSAQLLLVTGFSVMLKKIDLQIVGLYHEPEVVGQYNIVMRITDLCLFISMSVLAVINPMISSNMDKPNKIRSIMTRATLLVFLPTLGLAIFLIIFHPFILGIFGEKYVEGSTPLIILLIGQVLTTFFGPLGPLLSMTGYQKFTARYLFIVTMINVILNFIFIPKYGIVAAAVTTVISLMLFRILLYYKVNKVFGFKLFILEVFQNRKSK